LAAPLISFNIKVSDQAFGYLRLQKGSLDIFARDRQQWEGAYRASLMADYLQMRPFLPNDAAFVLDIGSGLGGIDILLHRHYQGSIIPILFDGVDDKPLMELHRKTFSNFHVAEMFHADNGVGRILSVDANRKPLVPLGLAVPLVISLGSWCFHYPPEIYLDYVLEHSTKGTILIIDVRKDKDAWRTLLGERFELRTVVHASSKHDRIIYRAR